jgi:hypothetical protein
MPYLSDAELTQLARVEPSEQSESSAVGSVVPMIGGMATAGLIGFVRAKLEDPATGQWNVPGTRWDAEAVTFLALSAVAFAGQYVGLGEYRNYAVLGAIGVGCHYAGEVARNFGRTGQLDLHVGGSGVPPWEAPGFDPSQYGEASRGLSEAA